MKHRRLLAFGIALCALAGCTAGAVCASAQEEVQAASLRLPAGSEQAFALLPPAGEDGMAMEAENVQLARPQPRMQGAEKGKLISVIGCASMQAEADGIILLGGIEAAGNSMAEATEQCEQLAEAVRKAFEPYGQVTEESFCTWPSYSGAGYTAQRTFRFVAEGTDRAEEMRAALADAGVRHIEGFPYCKNEAALRSELLAQALEDARSKAEALGAAGEPVHIEERRSHSCRGGSLTLEVCVRAVWLLESEQ